MEATVTRLGIHDASRVEWVTEFPLPEKGPAELELELDAEVPVHIWAEHDHWEHLQLLARLSSPEEGAPGRGGPPTTVDELRRATLAAVHRFKSVRDGLQRELFLAASLFSSAARHELAGELRAGVEDALADLFRSRAALLQAAAGEGAEIARERLLAAEFLSNHAIDFLSQIQRSIDDQLCGLRSRHRAFYQEHVAPLRPWLADLLAAELAFRDSRGFLRPDGADPWQLERYVSRASLLKKHFHEVLFLQAEAQRADHRFRNWVGVVAASLAALWAFPLGFLLTGSGGLTGLGLGLSTTLALLVLSYAVKDRIKESVRSWLTARVARGYAGRLTNFIAPPRIAGAPFKLIRARESFFTTRESRPDSLNPDLGPTRPVVRLRYRFRGAVQGEPRLVREGLDRAKLIFRYDLSPLFTRLDDPIKQVPILAEDGRAVRFAEAARCYRIPVRLSVRYQGRLLEERGELVTHKLGLERLDRPLVEAGNDPLPENPTPLASIPWSLRRR